MMVPVYMAVPMEQQLQQLLLLQLRLQCLVEEGSPECLPSKAWATMPLELPPLLLLLVVVVVVVLTPIALAGSAANVKGVKTMRSSTRRYCRHSHNTKLIHSRHCR